MTDNPYSQPEAPGTAAKPKSIFLYGCAGVIAIIVIGITLLILMMQFSRGRGVHGASQQTLCKNNLKQIGLALHNYHDVYGSFPPAFTIDENGQRLHSWRTLILPYMEQKALYSSIDLSKPWDDLANQEAYETNIATYKCPSADVPPFHATYLGLVGPDLFFNSAEPRKLKDITDGTSNTLMVVEVPQDYAVHWMSPQDADEQLLQSFGPKTDFPHAGGFQAALADGSAHFLSEKIDTETLSALMTVGDGETIGEF